MGAIKRNVLVRALVGAVACWGSLLVFPRDAGANLLENGDFQVDQDRDGWPDGWDRHRGVAVVEEGGNRWLRFSAGTSIERKVSVSLDWAVLRVRCRIRVRDVVVGDDSWKDARVTMSYWDGAGKRLDPWPDVFHRSGTGEWQSFDREFLIPQGTVQLRIAPGQFGVRGEAEFDDIDISLVRKRAVRADAPVPDGMRCDWARETAWAARNRARERVCLNGLWRFLPLSAEAGVGGSPPALGTGWGWFRVPGIWPTGHGGAGRGDQDVVLSDYMQERLGKWESAWYEREIDVPGDWKDRRVRLVFGMLQTHARVFLDGRDLGELYYPGGDFDVTGAIVPGRKQRLSLLVTARPLATESTVFMAPDRVLKSKAEVKLRGLTGDVYIEAAPAGVRISDVRVGTSVRQRKIEFDLGVEGDCPASVRVSARVSDAGGFARTFVGEARRVSGPGGTRLSLPGDWEDPVLWEPDRPHLYEAAVALEDAGGRVLDEALPVRFGFREFWIDGRRFLLNGTPIHFRALVARNLAAGARDASAEGCRRTMQRLRDYGFNFFIGANYDCLPGSIGYMEALLDEADAAGMPCSFTLPHVKEFGWALERPEQADRYRALASWFVRAAQNHPSVVLYTMNHNATGYRGDQNPMRIDGIFDPEDPATGGKAIRNRAQARLAEGMVRALDPTRPIYHHQSGNLGDLYTVNIYLNWAPIQERSDWLEHWAGVGVKPLFFVEWGLPHISSWSSYRGPLFIWRSEAFQHIWDSEYAAAWIGERAYEMTPGKAKLLEHEEALYARGKPFPWSVLSGPLLRLEECHLEIATLFAEKNWRAHRVWGISSMLPWDQSELWRPRDGGAVKAGGIVAGGKDCRQRPGIVADRIVESDDYLTCVDPAAVEPTSLGRAFQRWNMPMLGFIGGEPGRFTECGHNVLPGETVRKQLVMVNDGRHPVRCAWSWELGHGLGRGAGDRLLGVGERAFVPVECVLRDDLAPSQVEMRARFDFEGVIQEDAFRVDVLPVANRSTVKGRIAIFDPAGESAGVLESLGVRGRRVGVADLLDGYDLLVIGRGAIGLDGSIPRFVERLRAGMNVLVMEQQARVLSERFGFRVQEYGMRVVFPRVAGHPALAGLPADALHDWRGAATLVSSHLEGADLSDPVWSWCGYQNTRVWRCGNWGNVASVVMEKPERGNARALLDCGFDLQYTPLLEEREGKGRLMFCQVDITGRTIADPAANRLCRNIVIDMVEHRAGAGAGRDVFVWAGDDRVKELLDRLAIPVRAGLEAGGGGLLVVGPGFAGDQAMFDRVLAEGGRVLCLGLSQAEVQRLLPKCEVEKGAMLSGRARFSGEDAELFAGLCDADLHWRTRPELAVLRSGPGGGSPALRVVRRGAGIAVLCQSAPRMFDFEKKPYLRTTWRRNVSLVSGLLRNLGARSDWSISSMLDRAAVRGETLKPDFWNVTHYLQPVLSEDDPYRYYRW